MIINEQYKLSLEKITASIKASRYKRIAYDYDFEKSMLMLMAIGKGFCDDFEIDLDLVDPYTQMLKYFMADDSFEGDLYRGLLLKGKMGCGKSIAFYVFHKFLQYSGISKYKHYNQPEPGDCTFNIVRCKDIRSIFEDTEPGRGGDNAIKHFKIHKEIMCFDDLGEEVRYGKTAMHYNNECNVMEEILTARYESFLRYGTITHCSTNYNFESGNKRYFKDFYGERVEDRMKDMFNEITFKGESKRKRI